MSRLSIWIYWPDDRWRIFKNRVYWNERVCLHGASRSSSDHCSVENWLSFTSAVVTMSFSDTTCPVPDTVCQQMIDVFCSFPVINTRGPITYIHHTFALIFHSWDHMDVVTMLPDVCYRIIASTHCWPLHTYTHSPRKCMDHHSRFLTWGPFPSPSAWWAHEVLETATHTHSQLGSARQLMMLHPNSPIVDLWSSPFVRISTGHS